MALAKIVVAIVKKHLRDAENTMAVMERKIAGLESQLAQERESLRSYAEHRGELRQFLEVNGENPNDLEAMG